MKKSWFYTGGILVILLLLPFFLMSEAGTQESSTASPQEKASQKTVHPGLDTVKEKVGISVFLVFVWSIIFVLIYILRKKVKEADRLHNFSYFDSPRGKPFRKP